MSKVLKINFIELATRVMLGLPVEKPNKNEFDLDYVGIKASQFSFNRLQKADPVLGVDMASTGEVGCLGDDVSEAVLTSMLAVGQRVPEKNILLSTGTPKQKVAMLDAAKMLATKGYNPIRYGEVRTVSWRRMAFRVRRCTGRARRENRRRLRCFMRSRSIWS